MSVPEAQTETLVSAVIPTRDRGQDVVATVESILACDYPTLELIIVDQSSADATEKSLRDLQADSRLQILRSPTRGISAAQNIGISKAQGAIIALTDDDCVVPANWVRTLVEAFTAEPSLGIIFGSVLPGPHDSAAGFVPASICTTNKLARCLGELHKIGGMGACMGLRRQVWEQIGGFDERFGTGARIGAGEESEFLIRSLLEGIQARQVPSFELVHYGFRTWQQGQSLIRRYWYGSGAAFGVHVTSRPWAVARSLAHVGYRWISSDSSVGSSLGEKRHRATRLASFTKGFFVGCTLRPWRSNA